MGTPTMWSRGTGTTPTFICRWPRGFRGWSPNERRVTGTLGGETAPYHVLGELVFGDRALLQAGLASPEGQAAARDLTAIAAPGTLTLLAEDLD